MPFAPSDSFVSGGQSIRLLVVHFFFSLPFSELLRYYQFRWKQLNWDNVSAQASVTFPKSGQLRLARPAVNQWRTAHLRTGSVTTGLFYLPIVWKAEKGGIESGETVLYGYGVAAKQWSPSPLDVFIELLRPITRVCAPARLVHVSL